MQTSGLVLSHIQERLIIANSGVSRQTRCLKVVWSLLQFAYLVYARSESPGEVMRTCRFVGAFATRRCNKNHSKDSVYLVYNDAVFFSRCNVSINNYNTLYMVHSIPLVFYHILEL